MTFGVAWLFLFLFLFVFVFLFLFLFLCFYFYFHACFFSPPSGSFDAVIHMPDSTHKVAQPASLAFLGNVGSRLQLTLETLLVQATPVGSGKTRRAPSRHCGDARVYGHTTTAIMHDN